MDEKIGTRSFLTGLTITGIFLTAGLWGLGIILSHGAENIKSLERCVTVKGLSEREYPADIVIWPIQFSEAGNDASALYETIEEKSRQIISYLETNGLSPEEITLSAPSVVDKSAREYGDNANAAFRYTSSRIVTVYSDKIETVRKLMNSLSVLGREGIIFADTSYQVEYLFNRLNEVKPEMIEEATRNAREVAQRFADDSDSTLGKIRQASQGQFSISSRDGNNPHIKKVRVVSTVEYYLSD